MNLRRILRNIGEKRDEILKKGKKRGEAKERRESQTPMKSSSLTLLGLKAYL